MKTITKSVIKLSEIPEELHHHLLCGSQFVPTYEEYHIDDSDHDALTLWLLEKYPTLKRKISFLIHID
jgi:hypothetical protein